MSEEEINDELLMLMYFLKDEDYSKRDVEAIQRFIRPIPKGKRKE